MNFDLPAGGGERKFACRKCSPPPSIENVRGWLSSGDLTPPKK
jgi:hypothetical protein